jgi:ribosomal protein L40E
LGISLLEGESKQAKKAEIRCDRCSALLPKSAKYCGTCGHQQVPYSTQQKIIASLTDGATILIPLGAFVLWFDGLQYINLRAMNNLGLISVMPPQVIGALFILSISFFIALLRRRQARNDQMLPLVMLLHVALLIFMLYGITALLEAVPRFSIVYRHAGYTEFIMRTHSVDPNLDAYFNWPVFFIIAAFLTQIAGYHDLLGYAAWSAVFYNILYFWPLYEILKTATTDKRIVWLGVWFFFLTNWIGQDYISPQGLNFFLYLVIIALLLKWFKLPQPTLPRLLTKFLLRPGSGRIARFRQKIVQWLTTPDDLFVVTPPRQRIVLLLLLVLVFALVMSSHPLTPFFVVASIIALTIFRRTGPIWLPLLLGALTAFWVIVMAQTYLVGHVSTVIGDTGHISDVFSQNVAGRLHGDPQHAFISEFRMIMTFFLWALATLGALRRLRQGHHDLSYIVLAVAPFPLMFMQAYGGEMLMRVYLFTSPSMVFFAASLFFGAPASQMTRIRRANVWLCSALLCIILVLQGGFLFTRYGNEDMDYVTVEELTALRYMYSLAPTNSIFISVWDGTPWQFEGYERYNLITLNEDLPDTYTSPLASNQVNYVLNYISKNQTPAVYLIVTRTQRVTSAGTGLAAGDLDRFEQAMIASGHFVEIYHNRDAELYKYQATINLPATTGPGPVFFSRKEAR